MESEPNLLKADGCLPAYAESASKIEVAFDVDRAITDDEPNRRGHGSQRNARAGRESLEQVFALFPVLAERRRQRAGTMSGGEQQMLAIGRALMSRPKLILLDEPSAELAPVMVLRVFDLVRQVRQEGYTILIVEQNVRQVLALADRAYLLDVGRIRHEGRAADLADEAFVRKAYVGL